MKNEYLLGEKGCGRGGDTHTCGGGRSIEIFPVCFLRSQSQTHWCAVLCCSGKVDLIKEVMISTENRKNTLDYFHYLLVEMTADKNQMKN